MRVTLVTCTFKEKFHKFAETKQKRIMYYKVERVFRIISLAIALMLEIGSATFLS